MGRFFNRERFGNAQIAAGLLLLVFVAECAWLIAHEHLFVSEDPHFSRVEEGYDQWRGRGVAGTPTVSNPCDSACEPLRTRFDAEHSPLWYLIASAPLAFFFSVFQNSWIWF